MDGAVAKIISLVKTSPQVASPAPVMVHMARILSDAAVEKSPPSVVKKTADLTPTIATTDSENSDTYSVDWYLQS